MLCVCCVRLPPKERIPPLGRYQGLIVNMTPRGHAYIDCPEATNAYNKDVYVNSKVPPISINTRESFFTNDNKAGWWFPIPLSLPWYPTKSRRRREGGGGVYCSHRERRRLNGCRLGSLAGEWESIPPAKMVEPTRFGCVFVSPVSGYV